MTAWLLILLCAGVLFVFVLLVIFLLIMRYLNYRENVKMMEQGLVPQQKPKRNRGFLITGWIFTGLGFLVTILLWLVGALALGEGQFYPLALGPWVLLGLVPMAFGLLLLLLYIILAPPAGKQQLPEEEGESKEFTENSNEEAPPL